MRHFLPDFSTRHFTRSLAPLRHRAILPVHNMNQPIQLHGAAAIIPLFLHQLDRRLHFGLAQKGRDAGAERLVSRHGGIESVQKCDGMAVAQRRRHGR